VCGKNQLRRSLYRTGVDIPARTGRFAFQRLFNRRFLHLPSVAGEKIGKEIPYFAFVVSGRFNFA
jgi:hypothetical protein